MQNDCVIERGEKLIIKLDWTAKEAWKGVRFIIAIRTPNDNSTVGAVMSEALCDCESGKDYSVTVALNTDLLAKGKYFFNMILTQDDGEGNFLALDFIARACSIDIVESKEAFDKVNRWNAVAFGYIHYPELEVIE